MYTYTHKSGHVSQHILSAAGLRLQNHSSFLMMVTITPRFAVLFFFPVIAVTSWAVAYSPSSSSGSASGDVARAELECKVPPYSNPSGIGVNPTDEEWEELMIEGRCYLACITEKYQVYIDSTCRSEGVC